MNLILLTFAVLNLKACKTGGTEIVTSYTMDEFGFSVTIPIGGHYIHRY